MLGFALVPLSMPSSHCAILLPYTALASSLCSVLWLQSWCPGGWSLCVTTGGRTLLQPQAEQTGQQGETKIPFPANSEGQPGLVLDPEVWNPTCHLLLVHLVVLGLVELRTLEGNRVCLAQALHSPPLLVWDSHARSLGLSSGLNCCLLPVSLLPAPCPLCPLGLIPSFPASSPILGLLSSTLDSGSPKGYWILGQAAAPQGRAVACT